MKKPDLVFGVVFGAVGAAAIWFYDVSLVVVACAAFIGAFGLAWSTRHFQ